MTTAEAIIMQQDIKNSQDIVSAQFVYATMEVVIRRENKSGLRLMHFEFDNEPELKELFNSWATRKQAELLSHG